MQRSIQELLTTGYVQFNLYITGIDAFYSLLALSAIIFVLWRLKIVSKKHKNRSIIIIIGSTAFSVLFFLYTLGTDSRLFPHTHGKASLSYAIKRDIGGLFLFKADFDPEVVILYDTLRHAKENGGEAEWSNIVRKIMQLAADAHGGTISYDKDSTWNTLCPIWAVEPYRYHSIEYVCTMAGAVATIYAVGVDVKVGFPYIQGKSIINI